MEIVDPAPAALVSPTLPMDDMETVPEEIPSVALNELLPVSVKVPVPLMVNPPPALLMLPLTLVLPEPANVTVLAVLLLNKSPERVRSPESEVMRVVAPVLVILPVQVLLPEMLRRVPVPSLFDPLPDSERASPATVMSPCKRSEPPELTIVPAAVVPRALAFWMSTAPAEIVVLPA